MAPRWHALPIAFSWLTVVPVPARISEASIDRRVGAAVMTAVPVVGVCAGALLAVLAWALSATSLPTLLIGVLMLAALALGTRGMHIDGLADTADGLGCYGPPERVRDVMRSGSVGPFGVMTLIVVAGIDTVGFAALVEARRWAEIALVVAVGRVAAVIACRQSMRPSHPTGFGALVVGTQRIAVWCWTLAIAVAAALIGWLSSGADAASEPVSVRDAATVVVAVAFTLVFTRHCSRRMDGISGDVLGATIELSSAIALVVLVA